MTDIRQTLQYAKYLRQIGWEVERLSETNYFIKKVPLLGSVLKLQRPEELRYNDIKLLSAKHKAFQIIVEPKAELDAKFLKSVGYKLCRSPYLPTKTLQLDLTKSENIILVNLKKDARYLVRKTKNNKCKEIENIEEFRNAWKKSVGLKRYVPPLSHLLALKKSFGKNSLFISAGLPAEALAQAGAIFLIGDRIAYYWQAFTNKEGRKVSAQYQIVWQGILWAKKLGAKVFDFEGTYDKRFPNKSWKGFTHFKKSFGGHEVYYPGTFTKIKVPL